MDDTNNSLQQKTRFRPNTLLNVRVRMNKPRIMEIAEKEKGITSVAQLAIAGEAHGPTVHHALVHTFPRESTLIAILGAAGITTEMLADMKFTDIFTIISE